LYALLTSAHAPSMPKTLAALGDSSVSQIKEEFWCTIVVVAYLREKYQSDEERETWALIGEKAIDFLTSTLQLSFEIESIESEKRVEEWIKEAQKVIV